MSIKLFKNLLVFSIIIVTSGVIFAQSKRLAGDWVVDIGGEINETFVTNDSNSSFGLICITKCLWYVDFQKKCDDGEKYIALMADGDASSAVSLRCVIIKNRYILIIDDFDKVQAATLRSSNIGFAVSTDSGRFHVSRFSLRGSKEAQTQVFKSAAESNKKPKSSGFRDQSL
jgi:hypothetical protein